MHLTPNGLELLRAIATLAVVTAIVWAFAIGTRVRAMQRLRLHPQAAAHTAALRDKLPSHIQRIADNHNHLFEAPTLFYAVTLALVLLGRASPIDVTAAWAYVLFRIFHSVVQTTFNRVMPRFTLFMLSWLALLVLIADAAIDAFTAGA